MEGSDKRRSKQLDRDLLEESDLVIAMSDSHQQAIEDAFSDTVSKTYTLNELAYGAKGLDGNLDIDDPYRGDEDDYEECASDIKKALELAFDKIIE